MMAEYIKTGKSTTEIAKADAEVREAVQKILDDVQQRGDTAVRELSAKFDHWSPESFRLTQDQIDTIKG